MVDHLRQKLEIHQRELRQFVRAYNEKWLELFKAELEARELAYCTRCEAIMPVRESSLLLLEGWVPEKGVPRSELHRMCGQCGEEARNRMTRIADERVFIVFEVERIEGKMFARKHNSLIRLPPATYSLEPLGLAKIKKLMREWRHPLRLSLDFASDRLSFEE